MDTTRRAWIETLLTVVARHAPPSEKTLANRRLLAFLRGDYGSTLEYLRQERKRAKDRTRARAADWRSDAYYGELKMAARAVLSESRHKHTPTDSASA